MMKAPDEQDVLDRIEGQDAAPKYSQQFKAARVSDAMRKVREATETPEATAKPTAEDEEQPLPVDTEAPDPYMPDSSLVEKAWDAASNVTAADIATGAGAAAFDIAKGIPDVPGALARGVVGGANELADSLDSVGAWVAVQGAEAIGDDATARAIEARRASGEQALGAFIPDPGRSGDTVTANMVQDITQFATGFVAGGKILKTLGVLTKAGAVTTLGKAAEGAAKGFFSDFAAFDPAESRMADLVQKYPELRNPVTEFLSSKPGDSEATSRFKRGLEGLGLGAAADILYHTVRGIRTMRTMKPKDGGPPDPGRVGDAVKRALSPLGDETAPMVKFADDVTGDTKLNYLKINSSDDVNTVFQRLRNSIDFGETDLATRQKITEEQTGALAKNLGMSTADFQVRRAGPDGARPQLTAEEAYAANQMVAASQTALKDVTARALGPNAGKFDMYNFRKVMATNYAINQHIVGGSKIADTALNAMKLPAGHTPAQIRAVSQFMDVAGEGTAKMAKEMKLLFDTNATSGAITQYVRGTAFSTPAQKLRSVVINGVLSDVSTHLANFTANSAFPLFAVAERGLGRVIGKMLGEEGIARGEAMAGLHGLIASQGEAWALGYKALRTGKRTHLITKTDIPHASVLASDREDLYGTSINVLGSVLETPGMLMSSADEAFQAMNYRREIYSQAVRQTSRDGLTGAAAKQRTTDLIANPPPEIQFEASSEALRATFNSEMGWFGQKLLALRDSGGSLNPLWLVAPFMRTVINISRHSLERTPMAPLVGQWRADVAAGGARKHEALARMALGTSVMGFAQMLAMGGFVTGAAPDDPKEAERWRSEKKQPYAINVGGKWFGYNRLDPIGFPLGIAADIRLRLQKGEVAPKDVDEWSELMALGTVTVSKNILNKSVMRTTSQFFLGIADPKRYGNPALGQLARGFVPFSGALSAVNELTDPVMRDTRTVLDAVQAKLPFLSERIIPERDIWGDQLVDEFGMVNAFSPLKVSEERNLPINKELERLEFNPGGITWKAQIDGTTFDFSDHPKALDRYRQLAGNEWKNPVWGLGCRDFLDAVISGKHDLSPLYEIYTDGENGGKAAFISNTITEYRQGAARALLEDGEYADVAVAIQQQKLDEKAAAQKYNIQ